MKQPPPTNPYANLFDDPADFDPEAEGGFCENCHQHVAECLCEDDDFTGEWEE